MNMKTALKGILLHTKRWFDEDLEEVPFDNTYPWVGYTFQELDEGPDVFDKAHVPLGGDARGCARKGAQDGFCFCH